MNRIPDTISSAPWIFTQYLLMLEQYISDAKPIITISEPKARGDTEEVGRSMGLV